MRSKAHACCTTGSTKPRRLFWGASWISWTRNPRARQGYRQGTGLPASPHAGCGQTGPRQAGQFWRTGRAVPRGDQAAGQTWDSVYPNASICCCWTRQARHGQQTRLIRAARKGKLRQGKLWELVGDGRDSQLSPGHAETPLPCRRMTLQPLPSSAPQSAGSPVQSTMHTQCSPALRSRPAQAVPPSPRAPRPQEPPLTTKDRAGGSGQRHRKKRELARGREGAEHPGSPRLRPPPHPPRHASTPVRGRRVPACHR